MLHDSCAAQAGVALRTPAQPQTGSDLCLSSVSDIPFFSHSAPRAQFCRCAAQHITQNRGT